jgi:tRNA(Ile)-lysidine synthase
LNQIKSKDRALLCYLFKEIICVITGTDSGFYQNHLKEILSFLDTEGTKVLTLNNNVKVIKEYSVLTFTSENLTDVIEKLDTEQSLELTKKYQLFDNRRIVLDKLNIARVKKGYFIGHNEALLDSDKIVMPITVGYRQPGDKFIPLGMTGMKKLKDFFIDEKINKFDRDKIFVFRDSEKIIWIGGKRVDDRVKIDDDTQNALLLRIEEVKTRKSRTAQRKKQ